MSNHQTALSVVVVFLIETALAMAMLDRGWPLYLAVPIVAAATFVLAFITTLLVLWIAPPNMRNTLLHELDAEIRISWHRIISSLKKI